MKIKENIHVEKKCVVAIQIFMVLCINFLVLQFATRGIGYILSINVWYGCINIGIILSFVGIVYCFIGKLWLSEAICSVICLIYSIINQYVIEFHGSPLTIPEFSNTKTAINVLGGYSLLSIKPLVFVLIIAIFSVLLFFLINIQKNNEGQHIKEKQKKVITKRIIIFVFGIIFIGASLMSKTLTEPLQKCWHFKEAIGKYGYPLYFLASGLDYEVLPPDGYSEDNLQLIPIENYSANALGSNQTPDIILILNESFYDISLVTDVETDVNYKGQVFDMDNTISGHAVVPKIGGGTNNSEYELLTSNSTYLLQGITPFETLDMSDTASMVSNLNELGYHTIGMHPAAAGNYSRNTGYVRLGFDEIHFEEDFVKKEYYGERMLVTDACAYDYMIQWYENAIKESAPVFSYLLTIQNHGEWGTNESDEDIVHVKNCDNTLEEKLNEYLSCISLSVEALNDLIQYFQKSERPVILCMVGDHAPSFIEEITEKDINNAILQRATPFVIWANFPINEKKDVMVSINELGPLVLEEAGIKMMPYYQYILHMRKRVPVTTSFGNYIDADGKIFSYTDSTENSTNIQEYFFLEYNNLQRTSMKQWFSVE